ncbi:MAG TPA: SCO family protein, partial [Tepidisphaeraceae bacterium]|nr:SCO family protein [Tepidisphaeraceae bacterium]
PILLVLGYFTCPDLCPMTYAHLTEELNGIGALPGRDFQVLVISFDPSDTIERAAVEKVACLKAYKYSDSGAAWHFLTGGPAAIAALTQAVGFHYTYDPRQQEYVHPTGVIVVSPHGVLTHYFLGIDASPAEVESAIHDAAGGYITRVDQPEQEYCINTTPTLTPGAQRVNHLIQAACILWAAALFGYIGYKMTGDVRGGRRDQNSRADQGVES